MKFILRVLFKALLLFALVNLVYAGLAGGSFTLSAYNRLFPGRERLPFGETPREAYNFSLFDLPAMMASHEVAGGGPNDREFRVVLIGDSSVWGTLLKPEETLAGQLNLRSLLDSRARSDGRRVRFYNLGYPTLSLTKDLMILDETVEAYRPDLVIWLTTLESFPRDKQLDVPLVENNPRLARDLIDRYRLDLDREGLPLPTFWEQTLVAQRKNLADRVRLQLYGVLWAATGIDQLYPTDYPRAQVDLENDATFHGVATLERAGLSFDVLAAGARMLADRGIPLLLVNEPVMISNGANSQVRYNFYYPRGAYDAYRAWLAEEAQAQGYPYLDAWDRIPMEHFTNSAIHIDAEGTALLANEIYRAAQPFIFERP